MTEEKLLPLLPLLFIDNADEENAMAHALRYAYMDLVSLLYSEHFDGRIAEWCHNHGCRHIGHCIEDNEAASRLGYGAGHIFRAMAHADMAGVDVVIHQLTPGQDRGLFKGMHSPGWDGEFFTYLLAKFGGSLAHLDSKKRGQCMCELFGAYGWVEGNRLAKWLADHMLVRGVNVLVPHAFDCKPFPDADCPPHFCAEGHNPQYPEFKLLMDYCSRLCTLLSGGIACPDVALYFNAEGEWSGDYQGTQKPAAVLAREQIDYDLISADYLNECEAKDGRLSINGMSIGAVVLPWAQSLPFSLLNNIKRLANGGVPVYFTDGLPARCSEGGDTGIIKELSELKNVHSVQLSELARIIKKNNVAALSARDETPWLRSYHYRQPDGDVYFFVNESPSQRVNTVVSGARSGNAFEYDAFTNKVYEGPNAFALVLPPFGSKVVVVPDDPIENALPATSPFETKKILELGRCTISFASMEELSDTGKARFSDALELDKPCYVNGLPGRETFAGRIRYSFNVSLSEEDAHRPGLIVLDGVREGASVTVNGVSCGTRICPDYVFPLVGLRAGENTVDVELNTTLGRAMNDFLSSFLPMEPTGMRGARLELG